MNVYEKDHEDGECDCPVCHYRDEILWNDEGPLPDTCFDACSQCQILTINGVPCHETGCPNSWIDPVTQKGYPVDCSSCGFSYIPEYKVSKFGICDDCRSDECDYDYPAFTYWDLHNE